MVGKSPLDILHRPMFKHPPMLPQLSGPTQWNGRTTINSGSASVTVSNAMVASDQLVGLTLEIGSAGAGANSGGGIGVNSVVHGVSMALARPTGTAVPWDDVVMWEIHHRND